MGHVGLPIAPLVENSDNSEQIATRWCALVWGKSQAGLVCGYLLRRKSTSKDSLAKLRIELEATTNPRYERPAGVPGA